MSKKHELTTLLVSLALICSSPAWAEGPIKQPGRDVREQPKVLIVNVSAAAEEKSIFNASVTCEKDSSRHRKATDRTGTASLSFVVDPRIHIDEGVLACTVTKNGYIPSHQYVRLSRATSPIFVKIKLEKTR